jgi:DNA (cytosine-5)-methyltransferase 1
MAGYHVTGVDIEPQPRYCGDAFVQADAMAIDWSGYDLIWASPPCQRYSRMTPMAARDAHPNLLPVVLDRLRAQPTPYIVENVQGAQVFMRNPIMLCGTMFGLNIYRHRWFEIGNVEMFFLLPPCSHYGRAVLISGTDSEGREPSVEARRQAIRCPWMVDKELDEAIPPAYSKFLAEQMLVLDASLVRS